MLAHPILIRQPLLPSALQRCLRLLPFCCWLLLGAVLPCSAAELNHAELTLPWGIPFAGMLLSIALLPILAGHFWHAHYGKVTLFWAALFMVPFALHFGWSAAAAELVHALLLEYIPFIVLLASLFTVAGGICLHGNLHGSPKLNTAILGLGVLLASIMGTTGAAMLLIRPLIRANDNRQHQVHVVVFFIFLVANAGGALSPLGDPPLFLGFLKGVDFFWTTRTLLPPTLLLCTMLLLIFYLLDAHYFHELREELPPEIDPTKDSTVKLEGKANFVLLLGVIGAVLLSGLWKPGVEYDIHGTPLALQNLVRDGLLIVIALISLAITPKTARAGNDFSWAPIIEVAKLFIGIFLTIVPVIAMLKAGDHGPLASVVKTVSAADGSPNNFMYYWMTGMLSAFLDNAPTYLVFFNLAGGDPQWLMTVGRVTLEAISAGAVYMGALTYIGNAPNFMVKAIAEERGIAMPSFFGYLKWSCVLLLPCLIVVSLVFFI